MEGFVIVHRNPLQRESRWHPLGLYSHSIACLCTVHSMRHLRSPRPVIFITEIETELRLTRMKRMNFTYDPGTSAWRRAVSSRTNDVTY